MPPIDQKHMKNEKSSEQDGMFIGRNAVIELLKSGRQVDRILIRNGEAEGVLKIAVALAKERGIPVIGTDNRKLDALSGGGAHQGLIAYASETDYLSVEELFQKTTDAGLRQLRTFRSFRATLVCSRSGIRPSWGS